MAGSERTRVAGGERDGSAQRGKRRRGSVEGDGRRERARMGDEDGRRAGAEAEIDLEAVPRGLGVVVK
jgi:hypothetical protein